MTERKKKQKILTSHFFESSAKFSSNCFTAASGEIRSEETPGIFPNIELNTGTQK